MTMTGFWRLETGRTGEKTHHHFTLHRLSDDRFIWPKFILVFIFIYRVGLSGIGFRSKCPVGIFQIHCMMIYFDTTEAQSSHGNWNWLHLFWKPKEKKLRREERSQTPKKQGKKHKRTHLPIRSYKNFRFFSWECDSCLWKNQSEIWSFSFHSFHRRQTLLFTRFLFCSTRMQTC